MSKEPLYIPVDPQSTKTEQFKRSINTRYGLSLTSYEDLYAWSCSEIDLFWEAVWQFDTPILGELQISDAQPIIPAGVTPDMNSPWFPGCRVNWAENMLRHRNSRIALTQCFEPISGRSPFEPISITYSQLYTLVADLVSALLAVPIRPGDRVASYSSNCIENTAALLAATALGAIWVAAASDFGAAGVLERLEQVKPKVLFCVDAVIYNGKVHNQAQKVSTLLEGLRDKNCPPSKVIVIETPHEIASLAGQSIHGNIVSTWTSFVETGKKAKLGRSAEGEIEWARLPFNWPLWILFSSGTTGKPKPIVHRAGGMLLQMKKELCICADLIEEDVFFYYTTTGWMMYNWLISGLYAGCHIILYDGSPLKDPALLWNWVDSLKITRFGTSAKYLEALSRTYMPIKHHNLASLKHIYSTGSPLSSALFDYVYSSISPNVILASITGGSDICSLFAGVNTSLPVFRGEIQCRMLGMAACVYSEEGETLLPNQAGELVCTRPFPCQPLGFWPLKPYDTDEMTAVATKRYYDSYYAQFPHVWYHGDHVMLTESRMGNAGGMVMLGRSDGVLNPGGIRFGSVEIYEVIERCFSPEAVSKPDLVILNSLAVGQMIHGGSDERVILFVVLQNNVLITEDLEKRVKMEIRKSRTARHVPSKIIQVNEIPETLNGKRVEVPVKKIINGASLASINPSTLKNPKCLEDYANIGVQLREEIGRK